jgi:UDP-N-acetyl-D-glucosamine dehydrogenase
MIDPRFPERVASRDLVVAVVGLGYVGLPLAMAYATAGFRTIGVDTDVSRVDALTRGVSHIDDVSGDDVAAAIATTFEPTTDWDHLGNADVIFLCVPTPFDATKTPDLSFVQAAGAEVARMMRRGAVVVLQSTTYPGTTVEVLRPILERVSGLRAGSDFHLAYSPERVDPGNQAWSLANTPKVCGGVTRECAEATRLVLEAAFGQVGLVTIVPSPEIAELAKLVENTYRAVNIAYVNELAMLAHEMGIDIWDVLDAAATKPFGYEPFVPGIGPGGQCIPVNPYYLSWRARTYDFHTSFIELAGDINLRMVNYVMHRIHSFTNRISRPLDGARVLCLGAAFKAGVSDVRNSRAIRVMELLEREGAQVQFCDPLVTEVTIGDRTHKAVPLDALALVDVDLLVVLVRNLAWPVDAILHSGVPIFDAVNALGTPAGQFHERL